ncbi:MAG: hypothetical protein P8J20_11880 [Novosphingobium sp.]|nr:hypothetical protein [Novosphingobium sp.]
MESATSEKRDRYFAPGTRVRRDAIWDDDEQITSEFGVVIHCWLDDELGMFDCYVAFFGLALPSGKPAEKPYVLRYTAASLDKIDE